MIDIQKLKYDLAMQSALAATVLNRNKDESLPEQFTREFVSAYGEICAMDLAAVTKALSQSEQLMFKSVNALLKEE